MLTTNQFRKLFEQKKKLKTQLRIDLKIIKAAKKSKDRIEELLSRLDNVILYRGVPLIIMEYDSAGLVTVSSPAKDNMRTCQIQKNPYSKNDYICTFSDIRTSKDGYANRCYNSLKLALIVTKNWVATGKFK